MATIPRAPLVPHGSLTPESGRRAKSGAGALERVIVSIVVGAGSGLGDATQTFVGDYAKRRLVPTVAQAIGAAARELLSNAASYGSVAGDVLIEIVESPGWVEVRVTNEATSARIDMLQQHMKRLLEAGPESTRAQEARRGATGQKPMLGLAKLAQEHGLDLNVQVNARKVTVTARREQ